ncbi:MAG: hypothetical protein SO183_07140 [Fusobacterium mortiferum]|nr:hypothetical protein [Fusobacterium mortiferum]
MESKITNLIFLSREYNENSDEDINLTVEEGKPTVYVMGDRYQANTWEEVLDKAIRTITRWIEEEKEANRKEIEEEAIISKIWEDRAS